MATRNAQDGEVPRMRVLIVEDDALVRSGIVHALKSWGAEVLEADSEQEGLALLALGPSVVLADVRLPPNGCGLRVAEAALRSRSRPRVLAISGEATPSEAFQLAQMGVTAYLPKPLDLETFAATVEHLLSLPPPFEPAIAMQVGSLSYPEVLERVRRTMLEQALARTDGNKHKAAQLLQVTRQAVQYIFKNFEASTEPRGPRDEKNHA